MKFMVKLSLSVVFSINLNAVVRIYNASDACIVRPL